jgi:tryptophan synthase alpha chain
MTNRLVRALHGLRARGGRGLIPYVTAGDGGMDLTLEVLSALERAGACAAELGLPFSDPIADGPILQAAAQRSLERGTTLEGVLGAAREFRASSELPLVLMSYANPLARRGWARSAELVAAAGVDGLIVVDLPPEEAGALLSAAGAGSLATVFFAAPTSSDERVRAAARASRGFLYAIGRLGVTGGPTAVDRELLGFLERMRGLAGTLPVAAGFGIRSAEQLRAVHSVVELAIVGSALVERVHGSWAGRGAPAAAPAAAAAESFLSSLIEPSRRT